MLGQDRFLFHHMIFHFKLVALALHYQVEDAGKRVD
jgi:hypothetical protein